MLPLEQSSKQQRKPPRLSPSIFKKILNDQFARKVTITNPDSAFEKQIPTNKSYIVKILILAPTPNQAGILSNNVHSLMVSHYQMEITVSIPQAVTGK